MCLYFYFNMQLIFNGFNGSPHGIGRIPRGEPLDGLSSLPCSTPQPPRSLGVCHPPRRVLLRLQRTRRSRGRPSTLPLVSQITPFVVGRLLALSVKWGVCVGEMWVHPSLSVGGGYWSRQDFLFFVGGGVGFPLWAGGWETQPPPPHAAHWESDNGGLPTTLRIPSFHLVSLSGLSALLLLPCPLAN